MGVITTRQSFFGLSANWKRPVTSYGLTVRRSRRAAVGLSSSDWTPGFLSRHSVRNPGVCLDELAIALHVKGGAISTVLVEAETAVEPPVSVTHVQWLDMHDWSMRLTDNSRAGEEWYRSKLDEILALGQSEEVLASWRLNFLFIK